MVYARKLVQLSVAALCLIALQFLSCGKHSDINGISETSTVTFLNESKYSISIYRSNFGGVTLADMLAPGNFVSMELSPSNNYGLGDVFSIRYWYSVAKGVEFASGDVWTGGFDPNMQIARNIEIGKDYVIQIPNPLKPEWNESYVKILNASTMPIEFNYLGSFFRQAGNGELHIPSGKTGVYKVEGEIKGYTITLNYEQYPFPEFTAEEGYIYNFKFDGESVAQMEVIEL